ncbi:MAG: hypothetical protein JNL18_16245 [Planctomycetaceae bacterium]|nr:hypothetical protein [Planctomycetaceae bacterium]
MVDDRTTEHWSLADGWLFSSKNGIDRGRAVTVARMAARDRNASVELEQSGSVVKRYLARRRGAEAKRLPPPDVQDHGDAVDGRRRLTTWLVRKALINQ